MERIAVLSIIVEEESTDVITKLNAILHEYKTYAIGRLGVPDRIHGVNIISVALCAPTDVLNGITGKIGRIDGVTAKILMSSKEYN